MNEHRAWWTVRQLAEHYKMSSRTIYAEIESGRLIAHRFGKSRGAIRVADADRADWEARSRKRTSSALGRTSFHLSPESAHLIEKHLEM